MTAHGACDQCGQELPQDIGPVPVTGKWENYVSTQLLKLTHLIYF